MKATGKIDKVLLFNIGTRVARVVNAMHQPF